METVIEDHTPLADYLKGSSAPLVCFAHPGTRFRDRSLDASDTAPPNDRRRRSAAGLGFALRLG